MPAGHAAPAAVVVPGAPGPRAVVKTAIRDAASLAGDVSATLPRGSGGPPFALQPESAKTTTTAGHVALLTGRSLIELVLRRCIGMVIVS